MLEYLCKKGTFIKGTFSWKREHSPNQKFLSKSKRVSTCSQDFIYLIITPKIKTC